MPPQFEDNPNFQTFRECLSAVILKRSQDRTKKAPKKRRSALAKARYDKRRSDENVEDDGPGNPEDVADFINYLASETFSSLPEELQTLSYSGIRNDTSLARRFDDPMSDETVNSILDLLPGDVEESLSTYRYIEPPRIDLTSFMTSVLNSYVSEVTAAPSEWIATKASACAVCERDWVPLTYHHLIPRGVHAKVLKRGWHEEWMLNSVAWLCRACHNFVHRMASNEELAKELYTIDKILRREDVQSWKAWVGKVRWKTR